MDGERVEVEMLRTGAHYPRTMGGRPASGPSVIRVNEEMIDSLVRGFYAAKSANHFVGGGAPVGYEHDELKAMRDSGTIDPADVKRLASTFSDVRKRMNEDGTVSLMGSFDYTDEGRAKVRGGEFRGFSLVFLPPDMALNASGEPIPEYVPIGGTLTNKPFVRTMEPIAASEAEETTNQPEIHEMDIKLLRGPLALSEDATEAQVLATLHALTEKAATVDAVTAKNEVLSGEVKALTEERDEARERIAALSERDKTLTIRQAIADGRIEKAQEDRYWKVLTALGEEEAHAIFPLSNVQTASKVPHVAPKDGEHVEESASDVFDRVYVKALAEHGDEHKAYRIADEATRDLRNKEYSA